MPFKQPAQLPPPETLLLTYAELAAVFKVSIRTIQRRVKAGIFEPHHIGGTTYFLYNEVMKCLQENGNNPPAPGE